MLLKIIGTILIVPQIFIWVLYSEENKKISIAMVIVDILIACAIWIK